MGEEERGREGKGEGLLRLAELGGCQRRVEGGKEGEGEEAAGVPKKRKPIEVGNIGAGFTQ